MDRPMLGAEFDSPSVSFLQQRAVSKMTTGWPHSSPRELIDAALAQFDGILSLAVARNDGTAVGNPGDANLGGITMIKAGLREPQS